MNTSSATRGRGWRVFLIVVGLLLLGLAFASVEAGRFLLVDSPQPSDVVVVLAGETDRRPLRALELLAQGYARHIVLDVPVNAKLYEFTQIQLAEKYIEDLHLSSSITVCPIYGLSTKDESKDAARCLAQERAGSVLIVTSDFHTRRALSVFQKEVPQYRYSAAAAYDREQFGVQWWKHRQWAKQFFDEWIRLLWWKAVDQWR